MTNAFKSKGGPARIKNALIYSLRGVHSAFVHEAAFRQELALVAAAVVLAFLAPVAALERLLLIGVMLLVLIVELLNSAIETVVDYISTETHPLAGRAKDIGSAAVFLTLLLAALTWAVIAGPHLLRWVGLW